MTIPLDSRETRIVRWLLDQDRPRRTDDLATDLGLSQRAVRYRLGGIERYLAGRQLALTRQRGVGIWVEGSDNAKESVRAELDDQGDAATRVFARDRRTDVVRANLLAHAPDVLSIDELQRLLEVSKTSARRDVQRCEPWLESQGLYLVRKPGVGINVAGPEAAIRQAMVKLVLEAVARDVLYELARSDERQAKLVHVKVNAGMRDFLSALPLHACWLLVEDLEAAPQLPGEGELLLPIHLAVAANRIRRGRTLDLEAGLLRSLTDHPVFPTAEGLATRLADVIGEPVPDAEVAGITQFLLGLASLGGTIAPDERHAAMVDEILATSADMLHPILRDDVELRRSLSRHIERLSVRMRYALPVHNPLLQELVERYPEVHAVAEQIADGLSAQLGVRIPEDEVGFITMYLSGAMERASLRPRKRAVVVCPSGMATVWILVSRIQAEFPQLELVDVISATDYETARPTDADVVISTVELDGLPSDIDVVVVNPLLSGEDLRAIAKRL